MFRVAVWAADRKLTGVNVSDFLCAANLRPNIEYYKYPEAGIGFFGVPNRQSAWAVQLQLPEDFLTTNRLIDLSGGRQRAYTIYRCALVNLSSAADVIFSLVLFAFCFRCLARTNIAITIYNCSLLPYFVAVIIVTVKEYILKGSSEQFLKCLWVKIWRDFSNSFTTTRNIR